MPSAPPPSDIEPTNAGAEAQLLHDPPVAASSVVRAPPTPWYAPPVVAVDCLYNGSRSTAAAMISFAFVATCATTILVFSMVTTTNESTAFAFDAPPPQTAFVGFPWANFSVRLTREPGGVPLVGNRVSLDLFPVQPIPMTAVLPDGGGSFSTPSVDCLGAAFGLEPLQADTAALVCNVVAHASVTSATTDANGVASFNGLTVRHGGPGKYVLVLQHSTSEGGTATAAVAERQLRSVVRLRTVPLQINVSTVTEADPPADPSILAAVSVAGTARLDLRDVAAAGQEAVDSAIAAFNEYALKKTPAPTPDAAAVRTKQLAELSLVGLAMPIDLSNVDAKDWLENPLVFGASSAFPSVTQLAQAQAPPHRALTNARFDANEPTVVVLDFDFTANIAAVSQPGFFVAVYVAGSLMPLMPNFDSFRRANLYPRHLAMPFPITAAPLVSSVRVTAALDGSDTVSVPNNGTVRLSVSLGAATAAAAGVERTCFMVLQPLVDTSADAVTGTAALQSAVEHPVALLQPVAKVAVGQPVVVESQLSARGVAGHYNLTVSCDGVFSAADVTVIVTSRVSGARTWLAWRQTPLTPPTAAQNASRAAGTQLEYVAAPWSFRPSFRVLDADGAPLAGRRAALRVSDGASNDEATTLVYFAGSSDADGWIDVSNAVVPSLPAPPTSGQTTTITVDVRVDGVFIRSFDVVLLHDAQHTSCSVIPVGGEGTLLDVAAGQTLSGFPELQVVDEYQRPVSGQSTLLYVSVSAPVEILNLFPAASAAGTIRVATNRNGTANLNYAVLRRVAIPQYLALYVQCVGISVGSVGAEESGDDSDDAVYPRLGPFTGDYQRQLQYLASRDSSGGRGLRVAPIWALRFSASPRVRRLTLASAADQSQVCSTFSAGYYRCAINFAVDVSQRPGFTTVQIEPELLAGPSSYQLFYRDYEAPASYKQAGFQMVSIDSQPAQRPANGAQTLTVTVTLQVNPSISGTFVLAGAIDGIQHASALAVLTIPTAAFQLDIVTPTEWAGGSAVSIGQLQQGPELRVRVNVGGTLVPVPNVVVFVQLEVDGELSNIAAGDIDGGAMAAFDTDAPSVLPMSLPSASNGRATFAGVGLGLLGAVPGLDFRVVYRVGETAYVVENPTTPYRSLTPITASAAGLVAALAPGGAVPSISVRTNIVTAPIFAKLEFRSAAGTTIPLNGPRLHVGLPPRATATGNRLPFTLSPGKYQIRAVVPGAASAPYLVVVSSTPSALELVLDVPSQVALGQLLTPAVVVKTGGQPVPNVPVSVRAKPSDSSCGSGEACGELVGSAAAVSDENGVASFSVYFSAGASGTYRLEFTVADASPSSVDAALLSVQEESRDALGPSAATASGSSPVASAVIGASVASLASASTFGFVEPELLAAVLPTPGVTTTETKQFVLVNPVAAVTVITEPAVRVSSESLPRVLTTQPMIRLLNATGGPVPNVSVVVLASSGDLRTNHEDVERRFFSDANGTIRFAGLEVGVGTPAGTYTLAFSSRGTRTTFAGTIIVTAAEGPSMDTQMKIVSFAVMAVLMPLKLANVPHTSWRWIPLAVLSLGVVAGVAVVQFSRYLTAALDTDAEYLSAYVCMMLALYALMLCAVLVLAAQRVLAAARGTPMAASDGTASTVAAAKQFDGEQRAWHVYHYTRWLASARREKGLTLSVHRKRLNDEIRAGRKWRFQSWCRQYRALQWVDIVSLQTFTDDLRLPPLDPPRHLVPAFVPLKFYIVLAVTVVMYALAVIVSAYAVDYLRQQLLWVHELLPKPPASSTENWDEITQQSLLEVSAFIAVASPQLSWVGEVLRPLSQFDFFATCAAVTVAMKQVIDALPVAVIAAHVAAAASVIAVVFASWWRLPELLKGVHRGGMRHLYGSCDMTKADEYIGIHCILFVAQHQFVFWVVILVSLAVLCDFSREYLWAQLGTSLLITIGITVASAVVEYTVVKLFVVDQFTVLRPLLCSLYSVYAAVIGVFSGLLGFITRTAKAFAGIFFLTPMLEMSILPGPFAVADDGYVKFYSMLLADNELNHPVMLTALAVLVVDTRLLVAAREAEQNETKKKKLPPAPAPAAVVEAECGGEELFDPHSFGSQYGVASIVNVMSHRVAWLIANAKLPLGAARAADLVDITYARTARRWWLLFVLHQNPSIRRFRKWRIRHENGIADLAQRCASGGGGEGHLVAIEMDSRQAVQLETVPLVNTNATANNTAASAPHTNAHTRNTPVALVVPTPILGHKLEPNYPRVMSPAESQGRHNQSPHHPIDPPQASQPPSQRRADSALEGANRNGNCDDGSEEPMDDL